ncbi:MAG TPA: site-specific DNA-methyltransferase [Nocardioides sp.]|uniref:DNA-methyltransferase n=1 Tax=Nocardioides sp. TaxID=35761 RepID=UPI002ED849B1
MKPYYSDDLVTLYHGDSLTVLRELPDASVDCCVTSPPYFGLRDYGEEGQYGLESSPAEYVETMRALFAEVRRVLTDDGTLWLNIGDSYYSGRGNPGPNAADEKQPARRGWIRPVDRPGQSWAKPKDLLGIPWRVAFALQDDGWTLRNDIIWAKPNAMPESVSDRLATRHEHLFLLTKGRRYWFDLDPIREPHSDVSVRRAQPHRADPGRTYREGDPYEGVGGAQTLRLDQMNHPLGRNPGDVWSIPTQPFPGAHFAVMPQALAERCILGGCKPGGVVLDPFSGSGTTGLAAAKHGRKYVGIDLNADYLDLSLRTRLAQPGLDFGEASA